MQAGALHVVVLLGPGLRWPPLLGRMRGGPVTPPPSWAQGHDWVLAHLAMDAHNASSDTFTLGATFLGGLLGAHSLTGDPMLLDKARALADRCGRRGGRGQRAA